MRISSRMKEAKQSPEHPTKEAKRPSETNQLQKSTKLLTSSQPTTGKKALEQIMMMMKQPQTQQNQMGRRPKNSLRKISQQKRLNRLMPFLLKRMM
jgi:hypothetical protein